MKLETLLGGIKPLKATTTAVEIKNIRFDSRLVEQGDLFVATRGTVVDGHTFISKAIAQGAVAVVCETLPEEMPSNVAFVQVEDSAETLGILAANFYGNPSHNLTLVGVTGTNGKTTIATLLYQLMRALGYKVGLFSTVRNYVNDKPVEATHTTPNPMEMNALLAQMVETGCEYAFTECSSHAINQRRIAGLKFKGGIFTNLTRDHLDYHKTVENYLKAKKRFFDDLPADAFALTNLDDKNGLVMLQNTQATKKTYSLREFADFKTRILEDGFDGMLLEMNEHEIMLPFIGRFNASNLSAVFGTAVLLGFDEVEVLTKLSTLHAVSGRFETLRAPQGYTAIVDYAHTPDALDNVLSTINEIREGEGNLIIVVGCGGNRDKGKRPIMAKISVTQSDRVILTSDNPRFEDPQAILNDMLTGIDASNKRKVLVIVDRREAIKTACALAQRGDVILVAGKGHENYQIINDVKHHFDDKEEIINCF
ncbi:MAG: UDP-N-acetylmuramoyl-L-alanyl-D-glutamate--2,6-diaminopimelate ligase [Paludibacteraceae bacterium]|jgi:UDP-N-acetylmuramoyl-L-alanyl-D-glutamate--2,6-diaminopimelate ligase|nr:UDP-N-acetylmuramoyl-L-alanyl-D-glutamate--2,6-diaminopimelate ligase [Paludibacteraceae bacterium]HHT60619.1 UDP-N-acetylmuramoyl-L-alanyl-D-glutamate--2,6-diaminopimelate ligase [Bacteroidales bacterium]MBP9039712.1 UDP-N-acetylmuramoyl-L-alanyl-D-glutamate--2,6-diaminopimelate ligase [Paludibacteraceae bacterium]HOA46720.1 UDP-N-acetylmuramoyl-L-alanyl-D-glutamate--2,6-diaminopimelate ligase [Paludibacteraceae bacterium]HOH70546.1 UDP-N-acetylmuramoyl-L-alanyl-D-glutamate--2,6-diaminopime